MLDGLGDNVSMLNLTEIAKVTDTYREPPRPGARLWKNSLFESFYGGLQDPYRSQLVSATAQDSEGGQALSLEELADLAGFDTSKLSADDYQALQSAGIGQFANYMQGTGEKLENLQGYRSMLLSQAATEGSYAAEGLLGMAEEGSVSGLRSGRETTRGRQARKSLREAMQTQLLGGEESYQSELEGLRSEVVGGLREGLVLQIKLLD